MSPLYAPFFLLFCFSVKLCSAIDTITSNQFLQDSQFLVSNNGTFKLGFFNPANSASKYLGIWFNKPSVNNVVWVANRDKPIANSTGVLRISEDGNLELLNGQNESIWSSQVKNLTNINTTVHLQDSGNLVLLQANSTNVWQSFDHPTNTFLPGMLPTVAKTPNKENVIFKSWKSFSDPFEGSFSLGIGTIGLPQVFTWDKDGFPYWRSGPWDGTSFIGIGDVQNTLAGGFVLKDNPENGTLCLSFASMDQSLLFNYVVEPNGTVIEQFWDDTQKNWTIGLSAPSTECDVYATCGAFGICQSGKSPICKCLQGFRPKNPDEWKKGNRSSGCERKTPLQCDKQGGQQDGFLRLQMMKVPDKIETLPAISLNDCKSQCFNSCSCLAYSYHLNIGCMVWSKDLIDMQVFSSGGVDLFIRLASSDLEEGKSHKKTAIVVSTVIIGTTIAVIFICLFLFKRCIARGKRMARLNKHNIGDSIGQLELQEPPLYTFDMVRFATDNFHLSNKLGEGGFGPVYKGILGDGREIGVKRLSQVSGQGQEEFMNEVVVISKLQHRNLVRLLGCCIEADEKMLIYEYMPNKSLDAFLFDNEKRKLLSWEKRFNIIEGICRGLLYLHRDSRLRIIHRDLKTSNILLDEELNPKISDFGMARIFGGSQDQASTKRVVGTYGYMSPEYTMGQFSEKSDVYSFGVILLEIVSGRRNTTFHRSEHSLTLLAHAWKLWNEGKIVLLIDPIVSDPSFQSQIVKCIHVGLLCVQELAKDRPNMSTIITMLDSDTEQLPHPKKPPFSDWDISSDDQHSKTSSTNTYSITMIQPR